MSDDPPPLPEPLPPDPRSIGVWPAFRAGCRAWWTLQLVLFVPFAIAFVPLSILAVNLWAVDPGQRWLNHVLTAGFTILGCLAVLFAYVLAERNMARSAAPLLQQWLARAPATLGAWALILLATLVTASPLLWLGWKFSRLGLDDERAINMLLLAVPIGFVVLLVLLVLTTFLRLGPALAALRNRSSLAAIRQSVGLVRGHFWRILVFVLAVLIPAFLLRSLTSGLGTALGTLHDPTIGAIVDGIGIAVTASFVAVQDVALLRQLEENSERRQGRREGRRGGPGIPSRFLPNLLCSKFERLGRFVPAGRFATLSNFTSRPRGGVKSRAHHLRTCPRAS